MQRQRNRFFHFLPKLSAGAIALLAWAALISHAVSEESARPTSVEPQVDLVYTVNNLGYLDTCG